MIRVGRIRSSILSSDYLDGLAKIASDVKGWSAMVRHILKVRLEEVLLRIRRRYLRQKSKGGPRVVWQDAAHGDRKVRAIGMVRVRFGGIKWHSGCDDENPAPAFCTSVRAGKRAAVEHSEASSGAKTRRVKVLRAPAVEQTWLTVPPAWRKRKAMKSVALEVKRRIVDAQNESLGKV